MTPYLNGFVKAALLALLAFGLARRDLPQFEGAATLIRASLYPLATVVVPLVWRLGGRPRPYPHLGDAILVSPFLGDAAGSAVGLYEWEWFDEVGHFFGWLGLCTGFGVLLAGLPVGRLVAAALVVGFGMTTHVLWEFAEFAAVELLGADIGVGYRDTIGDLFLGFLGTLAATAVTAAVVWPRRERVGRIWAHQAPPEGAAAGTESRHSPP